MKCTISILSALVATISLTSTAFAGLENGPVRVERQPGCGATPIQWQSTTNMGYQGPKSNRKFLVYSIPNSGIDGVRVEVVCRSCSLYGQTGQPGIDKWDWWDTTDVHWRNSVDLGGFHSIKNGNNWYRGEERNDPHMCNARYSDIMVGGVYTPNIHLMDVNWGRGAPGTQNRWLWDNM